MCRSRNNNLRQTPTEKQFSLSFELHVPEQPEAIFREALQVWLHFVSFGLTVSNVFLSQCLTFDNGAILVSIYVKLSAEALFSFSSTTAH